MRRREKEGVHWLEFDLLADFPSLKHGVFLRHGGCSTGAYNSLNLGDRVGDDAAAVARNRQRVADILGIPHLVSLQQCHGNAIHEITSPSQTTLEGDALTTSQQHIGIAILHADCQAAIFYDPIHHAVANVHAGWRGSVQNIYAETIAFMNKTYGSNPKDLLVGISPSLGPQSAEFINYRKELPEPFWEFQVTPNHFDFWEISRAQLIACGVPSTQIEIAAIDTRTHEQDYFSYRRNQITGRHATVVALARNDKVHH